MSKIFQCEQFISYDRYSPTPLSSLGTRKTFEHAIETFQKNDGLLRTSKALDLGIAPKTLYEMRDRGKIIQESLGVYRLAEREPLNHPDLITIAIRVPKAVICLLSALSYHGLTTQIPGKVNITLPRGTKTPRIDHPPIDAIHLSGKSYKAGIQTHILDGKDVKIYSPEKTVADCFKFRTKIGEDVAIEALKDYFRQPQPDVDLLLKYARIDRVDKIILPYVKGELA